MKPLKIYLAGPDVFYQCDLESGQKKIDYCKSLGAEGIYPSFLLPEGLFTDKYSKIEKRKIINQQCKLGIMEADIIIANLTPFRGYEMDSGTAFEVGFADALGKIIYGYSNISDTYLERMQKITGTYQDSQGAWRDKNNHVIENFDITENCMIGESCKIIYQPSAKEQLKIEKDPLFMFKKAIHSIVLEHELQIDQNPSAAKQILSLTGLDSTKIEQPNPTKIKLN